VKYLLLCEINRKIANSFDQIENTLDEILNEVDLSDKKYDIVGILSGGQKKKLNVAML